MSNYDIIPKTPEKPMKSIFKSKTIWANGLAAIVSVVTMVMNSDIVAQNPEWAAYGATAIALINILLRFTTTKAVSVSGK